MAPIKEWFGAYNIIFNWFERKYGYDALEKYWCFIVKSCYNEVVEQFKSEGLEGIKRYFDQVFSTNGGECKSKMEDGRLVFEVKKCHDYEAMKMSYNPNFIPIYHYCRHHKAMNNLMAEKSGHAFRMMECDNNGTCKWAFEKINNVEGEHES